jgi:GxxExxY protein
MTLAYDTGLESQIIGFATRVHSRLGPGLLQEVYERCLCTEFEQNGVPFARQVDLPLDYDTVLLDCGYRADIIVRNEVLLELKSVDEISLLHEVQLQTYLRFSVCAVGLLLNFNTLCLEDGIRRRVRCYPADRSAAMARS